jgi:protein required for attachment to host cells
MRTGKTSHGVGLGETTGMPNRHRHTSWIVIMDRSQARFFEAGGSDVPLNAIHQIASPEGRVRGQELLADRPGRSFDSSPVGHHGQGGAARHAYSSAVSPHDEAAHNLVMKIVAYLEEGRGKNLYEHLILVAEPHFLGLLRKQLSTQLASTVLKEIEKDWAHLSGNKLSETISHALSSQESMGAEEKAM